MLKKISRLELAIWFAHIRVGSLNDEANDQASDRRFAMVAMTAMNGPHFRRPDKKAYTVSDFLPADAAAQKVERDIKAFFLPRMKKVK